jgi:hypothetical protein
MLKRILRKWPKGYADNEVALIRFLARILSDAHALQDIVITRLSADIVGRVVACMQSPHVKVLKAAFALAAPSSSHFFQFVKHQPTLLAKIVASVQENKITHWSPAVRSASEDFEAWYWDKVAPEHHDSVRSAVEVLVVQSRRVHRLGSLMAQVDGASMRAPVQGARPGTGCFPVGAGRSGSPPLERMVGSPFPAAKQAGSGAVAADADSAQCSELEADVKLWRQNSRKETVQPELAVEPKVAQKISASDSPGTGPRRHIALG